jgi:hypothetical protein
MTTIDRRSLLRGAAMAAFAAPLAPKFSWARTTLSGGGCCLCHRLYGANGTQGMLGSEIAGGDIVRSTGDAETDHFLGMALVRLATTFKVTPGFGFYDDRDSPNAFANQKTLLETGPGTVLMGKKFFAQQMAQDDDAGLTVIAILAHEFGHIVQMQRGYGDVLERMDRTQMPLELHADFLAGFYLAGRKAEHPNLNLQTVGAVFNSLGDTDFNGRQHHGTPEQRTIAITAGYNQGKTGTHDVDDAAQSGVAFVQRMM